MLKDIPSIFLTFAQVEFVGGDKPATQCKDLESEEVVALKTALIELVIGVSIAHAVGKSLSDY